MTELRGFRFARGTIMFGAMVLPKAPPVLLVVCVALAGCDRFGSIRSDNAQAANAAAPDQAKAAADRPDAKAAGAGLAGKPDGAVPAGSGNLAASGTAAIDRAYMTGRWTDDDDDCDRAADFFADGRFVPASGPEGLWSLNGDRLSIVAQGNTFTVQLVPIDANAMTVVNADGSLGRSTRC